MEKDKEFQWVSDSNKTDKYQGVAAPKEEKDFEALKWKVGTIMVEQFLKFNDGKFTATIELNPATHALTEYLQSELASLRQQLEQKTIALDSYYKLAAEVAPLKEALKELIEISERYVVNLKAKAIIERARKLISK